MARPPHPACRRCARTPARSPVFRSVGSYRYRPGWGPRQCPRPSGASRRDRCCIRGRRARAPIISTGGERVPVALRHLDADALFWARAPARRRHRQGGRRHDRQGAAATATATVTAGVNNLADRINVRLCERVVGAKTQRPRLDRAGALLAVSWCAPDIRPRGNCSSPAIGRAPISRATATIAINSDRAGVTAAPPRTSPRRHRSSAAPCPACESSPGTCGRSSWRRPDDRRAADPRNRTRRSRSAAN